MTARLVRLGQFPDTRDELRGTLAEIVATQQPDGIYGCPEDVAGASMESKGGGWFGSLGVLTSTAARDALQTAYLTIGGVTCTIGGVQYTWQGAAVGWVLSFQQNSATTVSIIGDSHAAYNGGIGYPKSQIDSKGFLNYANIILGGRLELIGNYGVGGQNTREIMARVSSIVNDASKIAIVIAGTNDRQDNGITKEETIANLKSMYTAIVSAGKLCVACSIPASGSGSESYQIAARPFINRWMSAYCNRTPGMVFADVGSAIMDPASDGYMSLQSLTTDTARPTDYTHSNCKGALNGGKILAAALSQYITGSIPFISSGSDNLLINADLSGSGSSVPSSWTLDGSATLSYVPRTDGIPGTWLKVVVPNGGYAALRQNVAVSANLEVGDYFVVACEYRGESLEASPSAGQCAFLRASAWNGSSFFWTGAHSPGYWDTTYAKYALDVSGVLSTIPMQVPVGAKLHQFYINLEGGGTYYIGRCAFVNRSRIPS